MGLVFEKASTRTRVSFAVACSQLGASEMMLSPRDMQLGRGEPIRDTARVLSRYLDALVVRTFAHAKLEDMARWADVPVVNALTDASHPCQVLADLLTVAERLGQDRVARGDLGGGLGGRRQQHGQQLARGRPSSSASSCASPARPATGPTRSSSGAPGARCGSRPARPRPCGAHTW